MVTSKSINVPKDILHLYNNAINMIKVKTKCKPKGEAQVKGCLWMIKREMDEIKGGILADDVGLGKTFEIIVAMAANNAGPTLFITEVSLMDQLKSQLKKLGGFDSTIASKGRTCTFKEKNAVVIASYSMFHNDIPKCLNMPWHRIVLDEAQKVRNAKTKTFKVINSMVSHIKWIMTATPINNSISDLENLASFVDQRINMDNMGK
jgi:SNF2 family DNA or RNA helicase